MITQDFRDMLGQLKSSGAEFLVVGAHALAAHGKPRATGDLDIWVRRSEENAERLWRALAEFGAPMEQFTRADLLAENAVIQLGVAPGRIDLMTGLSGVEFDQAWQNRDMLIVDGLEVPVIGRAEFVRNKRATGRAKDRLDADELEQSQ